MKISFAPIFVSIAFLTACGGSDTSGDDSGMSVDDTSTNGTGGGDTAGTGGSDTTDTKGPGPDVTMEEYCEKRIALEQPWCDYIEECCIDADKNDFNFVPGACAYGADTVADCVDGFSGAMEAGATWDGTYADACISELAKTIPAVPFGCSGLDYSNWSRVGRAYPGYSQIEACRLMFGGAKTQGEECDYSSECENGLICNTITGEAVGDYQCLPPGTYGAKCISDSQCENSLVCRDDGAQRRCLNLGKPSDTCLYNSECEDGLVCSGGQCEEPLAPGADCSFTDVCDGAYGCSFLGGTCAPLGYAGKTCSFSSECAGRCDEDSSTCVDICGGDLY